jgi:hypothetical protein
MTPERQKALEAVAEAARACIDPRILRLAPLRVALAALDALPPDPATAGEVVEVAVWRTPRGEVFHHVAGSVADCKNPETWTRLGTVRLPLTEGGR